MAVFNNILAGSSGQAAGGAEPLISRSLRFNSADSSFLSRTPASAGNRKTFTWAGWVKRSKLGIAQSLFSGDPTQSYGILHFAADDTLGFDNHNLGYLYTSAKFRDTSAWLHIVLSVDTTKATAADRIILYVNGVRNYGSSSNPTQNSDLYINQSGKPHYIGRYGFSTYEYYLDGYLADVFFVDGQALDPTSFGEFDTNGIWQPIDASGLTYGTNGFHLDFADNSTAAALGTDTSGNGNDWTVNNISILSNPQAQTFSGFFWTQYKSTYNDNTIAQTKTGSKYRIPLDDLFNGVVDGTSYSASQLFGITKFNSQGYIHDSLTSADGTATTGFDNTSYTGSFWKGYFNYPANSGKYASITVYDGSDPNGTDYAVNRSGCDSLVDVPTNGTETDTGVGGEVRGNYCTLNPLNYGGTFGTLSDGNLKLVQSAAGSGSIVSTFGISSGKWYFEVFVSVGAGGTDIGVVGVNSVLPSDWLGQAATGYTYYQNGEKANNGTRSAYGNSWTTNDTVGVALDLDNGKIYFSKNGTWQNSGNPATQTNPAFTGLSGTFTPGLGDGNGGNGSTFVCNFGQRPFAYTAPSGFKALNTANLPAPTIEDGSTAMDVALYTGTAASKTITDLNFSPDFVWIKNRSNAIGYNHGLFDIVRGANKVLSSSTTGSEVTYTQQLTSFNSDGFTLGDNSDSGNYVNLSGDSYVAWTWDAGSSTVTNNDGSITSSVRANPSAGFSIVTYTGNNTAGATIGHGLGVAPEFVIIKSTSEAYAWQVGHKSINWLGRLFLNLTNAASTTPIAWNDTAPTSSVITLGDSAVCNGLSHDYVAYCFAPVESYSAFGSYTGNGSADGPFVYTGFRPRWILYKRTDSTADWELKDTARDAYNLTDETLIPNTAGAAYTGYGLDILSNGFKPRTSGNAINNSGGTYIYAAFAENPFALNARAR
jgi:hypothetical protein